MIFILHVCTHFIQYYLYISNNILKKYYLSIPTYGKASHYRLLWCIFIIYSCYFYWFYFNVPIDPYCHIGFSNLVIYVLLIKTLTTLSKTNIKASNLQQQHDKHYWLLEHTEHYFCAWLQFRVSNIISIIHDVPP